MDTIALYIINRHVLYLKKLSKYKAQCKFKEILYNYKNVLIFKDHIKICHKEQFKYEEEIYLLMQRRYGPCSSIPIL